MQHVQQSGGSRGVVAKLPEERTRSGLRSPPLCRANYVPSRGLASSRLVSPLLSAVYAERARVDNERNRAERGVHTLRVNESNWSTAFGKLVRGSWISVGQAQLDRGCPKFIAIDFARTSIVSSNLTPIMIFRRCRFFLVSTRQHFLIV